ncbi:MAG TPA: hypothetical protein VNS46_00465 [Nocardioides sp.]|nr:hypothetical protein [Nocardioides sp.]
MSHHVVLRPGTPVMARAPGVLQVGLDGPTALVPDDPDTHRLLAALGGSAGAPDLPRGASAALDQLRAAGLLVVVPDSELVPEPTDQVLRAQFGPDAVRRRDARAGAAIAVRAAPAADAVLDPLLERAGLRRTGGEDGAAAHLVVSTGHLDRELLDPLVRSSVPHLVVSGGAGSRRVGPFVQPGHTACLRCVDAHEALHDARRPLLLAQAARWAAERPPPLDPVLDTLALAWAVRDLARYVEGDSPSTWSSTFDVGPTAAPVATAWGRHPDCGCAWDLPTLFD